jgi:hypothetical protein
MEGNKISREEIALILHRSSLYAQSNSLLEEDYLKVRDNYFANHESCLSGEQAV